MAFKYSLVFANNGSGTLSFAVPGDPQNWLELRELFDEETFDTVKNFVSGAPGTIAVSNRIHWNSMEDLELNEPTPLERLWLRSLTDVPKEDECTGNWTVDREEAFPAEPADNAEEQETFGIEKVKTELPETEELSTPEPVQKEIEEESFVRPEETEPEPQETEKNPPVEEQPARQAAEESGMEKPEAEETKTEEPEKVEQEPVPAEPVPPIEPCMELRPDAKITETDSPHNREECQTGAKENRKILTGLVFIIVAFIVARLVLKRRK